MSPPTSTAPPASATAAVRALARASRQIERLSGELNLAHYRVLAAIAGGDERASRVARRLAVGKPAVSASVDALCQRGLLARAQVAGDNRVAALRLTAEGTALLDRVELAMGQRVLALCARTPDADQVLRCLVWLGEAIDDEVDECGATAGGTAGDRRAGGQCAGGQ